MQSHPITFLDTINDPFSSSKPIEMAGSINIDNADICRDRHKELVWWVLCVKNEQTLTASLTVQRL